MATKKQSPSTDNSSPTSSEQKLLQQVKDDYQAWRDYTSGKHIKWNSYWKLYHNERVKRGYKGTSDTFDPMTFQMVETGVDNVYGSRPNVTFQARMEYQEKDTKILTGLWENTWDENNMDNAIMPIGRETKIVGNVAVWCEPADGYMKINHIPWGDNIFDPAGVDEGSISYGGYRQLVMLDDAKKVMRYDPNADGGKGAWVKRYKNLNQVKTWSGKGGDKTDKEVKECYIGSTLNDTGRKHQFELIRLYYADQVIEVANRTQVIYQGPNDWYVPARKVKIPLYDESKIPPEIENTPEAIQAYLDANKLGAGFKEVDVPEIGPAIPVALNRRYVDRALLIAAGDVEAFADTQEHENDVLNAKMDNIAYNIKNIAIVDMNDPGNAGVKNQLANANPGDIVEAKGGAGAVQWMQKPDMQIAADNEVARAKQSIRDTARIDQVVQGVSTDGANKTATEINAQISQASGGFSTEVRNLETGFYSRLGFLFNIYLQAFVTSDQTVRVLGKDGQEWQKYKADKFWGPYDCKVVLDTRAKAERKSKVDTMLSYFNDVTTNPATAPLVNVPEFLKKVTAEVLDMDPDDVERLIVKRQAPLPGPAGALPPGAGGPPVPGAAPVGLTPGGPLPAPGPAD